MNCFEGFPEIFFADQYFPDPVSRVMAGRGAGQWRGGRGAFYKNKYGGRGVRGAFPARPGSPVAKELSQGASQGPRTLGQAVGNYADLKETLSRMNGMSYPAYKDLRGI